MRNRLFVVRIATQAYVWAESAEAAKESQNDIMTWDAPSATVEAYSGQRLEGWDDKCMVYTQNGEDLLLGDALDMEEQAALEAESAARHAANQLPLNLEAE